MPVILATDFLFFLLIGSIGAYFIYAISRPHLLRPWQNLAQSRVAVISLSVIVFYVLTALLDSLHFRPRLSAISINQVATQEATYSNEVLSVLDWILTLLRKQKEKTYSSPFALHAYVKENVGDGTAQRDYPRLQFGGAHLERVDQRWPDISRLTISGIFKAASAGAILLLLLNFIYAMRRRIALTSQLRIFFSDPRFIPWRTAFFTLLAILAVCFICIQLSSKYHILGTDKVGEDVFYQAIKSIRTGVLIGTLTTLVMLPFALFLGITAGYFLGRADDVIQYIYTTLNSIPGVLLIAAGVLMLHLHMNQHEDSFNNLVVRADTRLLFLCIILGITSWTGLCRLLRAETLKVKSMDYITAAQALGVGKIRTILRHILPNVMHIVFITIALDFSGLVLAEAVLSYVNIGVDPTMFSWGNMINGARLEMAREPVVWWSLCAAFGFMFVLVLCANLLADAVRDAFDPYLSTQ